MKKKRKHRRTKKYIFLWVSGIMMGILIFGGAVYRLSSHEKSNGKTGPEELLAAYMACVSEQDYQTMYGMLDLKTSGNISQEDFIKRNSAIYEGIEMQNMVVRIISSSEKQHTVEYETTFDTVAGSISFENEAVFVEREDGYKLVWDDALIFPELDGSDKVWVQTIPAERGEISDRNDRLLARQGTASSVGIVPGKLENREDAINQIASLLEMEQSEINKKLSAGWVAEDSFVPLCTLRKIEETDLMALEPDEAVQREQERQQRLLEIPGVMITDTQVRTYPLGAAAAHLIGYTQKVTAEDLEQHSGEGYTVDSVIGRSGVEGLYEKELKGQNGCRIYIVDSEGREKVELAYQMVEHGKNIKLTIDADLQKNLYEQFQEDKSCSAAINPCTGEVLALVSTPSYDNNDFIMGMSEETWSALNENQDKPMHNRFRQTWCPGSVFKPVTAAIGLESGAVNPYEDYGKEGLSWQNDASWGSYHGAPCGARF